MAMFNVLSGGPGAGKTSVLHRLAQSGHMVMPEAGRHVIAAQVARGGVALPWVSPLAFARKMFVFDCWQYRRARRMGAGQVIWFDRGVVDCVGYLTLCGVDVPDDMHRAAHQMRYGGQVFLLPPWQEIYTQDTERKQDWDEAVRTYDVMAAVYAQYGYNIINVPFGAVDARADFVLSHM